MIQTRQCSSLLAAAISLTVYGQNAAAAETSFAQALARDYQALSSAEQAQGDNRDAWTYDARAKAAASGSPTDPDSVERRQPFLKGKYVADLTQARVRLVAALNTPGRDAVPDIAARAQASYDCWVEQAAEDIQRDDIRACRRAFESAVAVVESHSTTVAAETPTPRPPVPEPATVPDKYLVFFDWDQSAITAEASAIIDSARTAATGKSSKRIVATGYTDRSGTEAYNLDLSQRRAAAVKKALSSSGVQNDTIGTVARGEADPLVPTDDGVREAQNRRVEIQIEP